MAFRSRTARCIAAAPPTHEARDARTNDTRDAIEVMCELHSLWNTTSAIRICRALEDHGVFWAEDPIAKMDDVQALADLRRQSRVPICGSETLGGVVPFRNLLAADTLDFVMIDLAWCGGLTEGRKIAALAEAYTAQACGGALRQAGWTVNAKRVERIWRREGLKVPRSNHAHPRGRRSRASRGSRADPRPGRN